MLFFSRKYLTFYIMLFNIVHMMNKTSELKTQKRGRGRPRKVVLEVESNVEEKTVAIPALLEPNIHDLHDELSRLDSYAYAQYNE